MSFQFDLNLFGEGKKRTLQSSLDRFVRDRGVNLISFHGFGSLGFLISGGINATIGIIFTSMALLAGRTSMLSPGLFCALIGAGLLGTGIFWRTRSKKWAPDSPTLNKSGYELLCSLCSNLNWNTGGGCASSKTRSIFGIERTSSQVLHPTTYKFLEAAAFEFNRIGGVIQTFDAKTSIVASHLPAIKAAADEAMVQIINLAGQIQKTPESAGAVSHKIGQLTGELTELAVRLERIQTEPTTGLDRISRSSIMVSVLEQLKLEEDAREEIRYRPEPETKFRLEQEEKTLSLIHI